MELEELKSVILVETGQYLAPFEATLLSDKEFLRLVATELAIYNNHKQHKEVKRVTASQSGVYTFTSTRPDKKDLPVYIIDARTSSSGSGGTYWNVVNQSNRGSTGASRSDRYKTGLAYQQLDNFHYDKNSATIYFPESGTYEITCAYDRWLEMAEADNVVQATVHHITVDDYKFIRLVAARFMLALGRSRRAFTIEGIPVSFDASEMVAAGEELYSSTKESLVETSNWSDVLLS